MAPSVAATLMLLRCLTFVKCPCSVFNAKCHYNLYFFNNNNNNNVNHTHKSGINKAVYCTDNSRYKSKQTKLIYRFTSLAMYMPSKFIDSFMNVIINFQTTLS